MGAAQSEETKESKQAQQEKAVIFITVITPSTKSKAAGGDRIPMSSGTSSLLRRLIYDESPLASRYSAGLTTIGDEDDDFFQYRTILDDRYVLMNISKWRSSSHPRDVVSQDFAKRRCCGILFVYDVTNSRSWDSVKDTIDSDLATLDLSNRAMIIACKCDLAQRREVSYATVKSYSDEKGLLFMETSALEDVNVEYALVSFAAKLLDSYPS